MYLMCKQPHDVKDEDNESEEIKLIEEHIQDEIFTNSVFLVHLKRVRNRNIMPVA